MRSIVTIDSIFYEYFIDIVTESEYQKFEVCDEIAYYFESQINKLYPRFYSLLETPNDHIRAQISNFEDGGYASYIYVDDYFIEKFREFKPHLFI